MPFEKDEDPDGTKRYTFWFYISPEQLLWGIVFLTALVVLFTI